MIKATVYVTIKQSVLDPQGVAVQGALHSMGFNEVESVRIGKVLELNLDTTDRAEAEKRVKAMCEKLLANTVIEDYRFELEGEYVMNFAVLVFPGSNCDIDCYKAVEDTIGQPVDYVWHTETDLVRI